MTPERHSQLSEGGSQDHRSETITPKAYTGTISITDLMNVNAHLGHKVKTSFVQQCTFFLSFNFLAEGHVESKDETILVRSCSRRAYH